MIYRFTLRALNNVAIWETALNSEFDRAGKGKSALVAAAASSIFGEVYDIRGIDVISMYNDFEQFVDSLDLVILMQVWFSIGFPIKDSAFTLQQHVAPHIIQSEGLCSSVIPIFKSNT